MKTFLWILLIVGYAHATDIDVCKIDAENGCRDYSTAKKCGTTDACKSVVWNQPVNDGSVACETCKADVKNLEAFVSSKSTRQFVKYDLLATCRVVIFEAARNRCLTVIEENFDTIYQDIVDKLDPSAICSALHFCRPKVAGVMSLPDLTPNSCKLDAENACADYSSASKCGVVSFCKSTIWKVPVNNETTCCQKCLDVVGELQKFVEENATHDRIKDFLLGTCNLLPFAGRRNRCRDMVNENFEALYKDLVEHLDPTVVCRGLRLCRPEEFLSCADENDESMSFDKCKMDADACKDYLSAEKCGVTSYCKSTVWNQPTSDETILCSSCLEYIGEVEVFVSENETRATVKRDLLLGCSLLPFETQRSRCSCAVTQNFEVIYKDVTEHLDPRVVCSALKFCHAVEPFPYLDKAEKSISEVDSDSCEADGDHACGDYSTARECHMMDFCKSATWRQAVDKQTALCTLCLGDVENFQIFLNATEDQVKSALLALCDTIPFEAPQNKCRTAVEENFDRIYQDIVDRLDPDVVCRALRFCLPKNSKRIATVEMKKSMAKFGVEFPGETTKLGFGAENICDACKFGFKQIEKYGRFQPKSALRAELLAFCQTLADAVERKQCAESINKNMDKIYDDIRAGVSPEEICELVGACGKKIARNYGKMEAQLDVL